MTLDISGLFKNKNLPTADAPTDISSLFPQGEKPKEQPAPTQWDYKGEQGISGEELPTGAIGWTPHGDPYYGKGITGTFKKYWYNLIGNGQAATDEDWDRVGDLFDEAKNRFTEGANAFFEGDEKKFAKLEEKEDIPLLSTLFDTIEKEGNSDSLVAPVIRLSKVGVMAVSDLFSEAAIKFEQTLSANVAMDEYITGETLHDRKDVLKSAASSFLPPVALYRVIRFASAPGTFEEKIDAIEAGWDAGRVLYTSVYDPAVREQFLLRAEAGEDPQLLAMELENPWAELGGQAFLDPLILVGWLSKSYKTAKLVNRASASVLKGAEDIDEYVDAIRTVAKSGNKAEAELKVAEKFKQLVTRRLETVDLVTSSRLTQKNALRSLSVSGNVQKARRSIESFVLNVIATNAKSGGRVDDVAELMKYGIKSVSDNADDVAEGISGLMNFPHARLMFSEDAVESFVMMRNLSKNSDGVIDSTWILQKMAGMNGDVGKTATFINGLAEQAVKRQFPTFKDIRAAAATVEKAGAKKVSAHIADNAKIYNSLSDGAKETLLWADRAVDSKSWVNKILGTFYFNQYGFAVRNIENNMLTLLVDNGLGAFINTNKFNSIKDLKGFFQKNTFWSMNSVEDYLRGWFGGELPVEAAGFQTSIDAMAGGKLADKFASPTLKKIAEKLEPVLPQSIASRAEQAAATRIFAHRFRETVDMLLTPGKGLPSMEQFTKQGFTPTQVKHFIRVMKDNGGNTGEALKQVFESKKGAWQLYETFFDEKTMKGFSENGLLGELNKLVSNEKATPDEIAKWWDDAIEEVRNRQQDAAANSMPNIDPEDADYVNSYRVAETEGYISEGAKVPTVLSQSYKASDEYTNALADVYKTIPPNQEITEAFTTLFKKNANQQERAMVRSTTMAKMNMAHDIKREVKAGGADYDYLWKKMGIPGEATIGMSEYEFLSNVFDFARIENSKAWDTYFDGLFGASRELAEMMAKYDPSVAEKFADAEKAVAKANVYRGAHYGNGVPEVIVPDTITGVLQKYGYPDGALNNVVNKYAPGLKVGDKGLSPKKLDDILSKKQPKGIAFPTQDEIKRTTGVDLESLKDIDIRKRRELEIELDKLENGSWKETPYAAPRIAELKKSNPELFAESAEKIAQRIARETIGGESSETFASMSYKNLEGLMKDRPEKAEMIQKFLDNISKELKNFSESELIKIATPKGGNNRFDAVTSLAQSELKKRGILESAAKIKPSAETIKQVTKIENDIAEQVFGDSADLSITTSKAANAEKLKKYQTLLAEALAKMTDEEVAAAAYTTVIRERTMTPLQYVASQELSIRRGAGERVKLSTPVVTNGGATILPKNMWGEVGEGTIAAMQKSKRQMLRRYGIPMPEFGNGNPPNEDFVKFAQEIQSRVSESQFVATRVGKEWRDFALHKYGEQTNMDVALSFIYPYQFWYSRTYANWLKRLGTDPALIANYFRLKETLSGIHKESPEWLRYSVQAPDLLGINKGNPMIINLEAGLNPMYGLTGVDFNDPDKRVNWLTSTVDDMGKMGPSVWAPVQMAIAAGLAMKGEEEAASAFGGRLIPQTAQIKAASSYFGTPLETDPNVWLFSGGMDKWERNRVGLAMLEIVNENPQLEAEAYDALEKQSGELWDQAYQRAVNNRAPGQFASFLLGTGFKPKTLMDAEVDKFYQDYAYLNNQNRADLISPEMYKEKMNELRTTYPFMDMVLLSKRGGEERFRAYSYHVLGRIPPGQMTDMAELAGINPDMVQKYYDGKGDMSKWTEGDRKRFEAFILDVAATFEVPKGATREEWLSVKNQYDQINKGMESIAGKDVWKKIDAYYDILDKEGQDAANFYMSLNPEVQQAMTFKDGVISQNPLVATYYGGFDVIQRYYSGIERQRLAEKYGAGIYREYFEYLDIIESDLKKQYLKEHPRLAPFMKEKSDTQSIVNNQIISASLLLPSRNVELRPSTNFTPTQQGIANQATAPEKNPQDIVSQMTPALREVMEAHFFDGAEIKYSAKSKLDYLARENGMSTNELIQLIGIGLMQQ